MNIQNFATFVHKEESLYVAECPEVGTTSQGTTIEEARANLKEATELYLEEFPLSETSRPALVAFEVGATYAPQELVSGEETIRALERLRFARIRQSGSHVVLKRQTPSGDVGCVVPLHAEVAMTTLRNILRQARMTPEEFIEHL